jgi:hypothetical protein
MYSSVVAFRRNRRLSPLALTVAHERSVQRRVKLAWGLMFLNALGFSGALVHIPTTVGKLITQGALPAAILVALTVNRKMIIRPNLFLCLVSLLAIEALLTALQIDHLDPHHLGTIYRSFRLAEFATALWLLTPWWGRRDLLLVRCHLTSLAAILGSVLVGIVIAPSHALVGGRLGGALWTIPSTQVAHYAAVATGLVIVLWLCRYLSGRVTLPVVLTTTTILVLTHTRTALIALVAGVLVAGLSLIVAKARARKMFAIAGVIATVAIISLSGFLTSWLARGEGSHELTSLTGRTLVWSQVLAFPRDKLQEIFGFGLSNSSFNGLPIDSNWISSYYEQGLFGVGICVAMLLFLLVAAYFQVRGVQRALALFLVTYCLIASFTEDGFTDATPYLLELALAASLLVFSTRRGSHHEDDAELQLLSDN